MDIQTKQNIRIFKRFFSLLIMILSSMIFCISMFEVFSMPTSTLSTIFTIPTICLLIFTFFSNLCYIFYPPILFSALIITSFAFIIIEHFKIALTIYFPHLLGNCNWICRRFRSSNWRSYWFCSYVSVFYYFRYFTF